MSYSHERLIKLAHGSYIYLISGQVQQECLDIISVDQTIFRADPASLRDVTPRILKRIVALPRLPVSEEGLFLFLIKWKEYHRLDNDHPEMVKILDLIRFPCMRGQFLADVVQPTGLVKMDALADYPCSPREVQGHFIHFIRDGTYILVADCISKLWVSSVCSSSVLGQTLPMDDFETL